ncbi:MAG: NADH-quinone oxidoreductase subunit N [Planctomycetota bacterium]
MNLETLTNTLVTDTVDVSLPLFRPELILCGTIVVLLLLRILRISPALPPFWMALAGAVAALAASLPLDDASAWNTSEPVELFTGMLIYDSVTGFMRVFLLAFAVLFILLSRLTGLADNSDGQDVYTLLLGSTIGMCLMASANHMMTVFLAVEMASVPSYVLAGVVKGRRRSSEAALKYAVYGAGAAGVMLYGISLLCGVLGTAHLPTMATRLVEMNIPQVLADGGGAMVGALALGGVMLGVGLAFKLSAVPFHFWCPDVFEGASAEVGGFLSVASKAAALALLLRVGLGLGHSPSEMAAAPEAGGDAVAVQTLGLNESNTPAARAVADSSEESAEALGTPLDPVRKFIVILIALVAAVTCTFGNLAAYGQTNIKRMLAYSTIAHAGYMMMAAAAAVALVGQDVTLARTAVSGLLLYASFYLFMNLGAFSIVAVLRNAMQSEEIQDYAGLIRTAPAISVAMVVILFSLVGLPPLAGFIGKFAIFRSLVQAGGPLMIFLLVTAGLNTAVSLVYYLRVAKVICIDSEPDTRGTVTVGFLPAAFVLLVALPVLVFGVIPEWMSDWTVQAASQLLG